MKYAVVTIEWLAQHGLLAIPTMRKSKDGSKVILHEEFLTPYKDEEFPRYYFDSPELNALLSSDEWSWTEEEQSEGSAEFIQMAAAQNLLNVTQSRNSNYVPDRQRSVESEIHVSVLERVYQQITNNRNESAVQR